MTVGILLEMAPGERRVALVPASCASLIKAGHSIIVQSGAGSEAGFPDEAYTQVGATVGSRAEVLAQAACLAHVAVPTAAEISEYPKGATIISLVYPKRNPDTLAALAQAGVSAFAMDAMPRTTRAQNMDVLSSQNNLAGYKAVVVGANAVGRVFPLMMTAAGTVTPVKMLIYGAGVAGLQAIATAKRLGARVEVTDIRPETKEQVESLGAKFVWVDGLENVRIEGGYVAGVTDEILQKQKEAVEKSLFAADVVITTALVAGGKAPTLITADQVSKMKYGSVIVDMATDAGGNCESSKHDAQVTVGGVTIIGGGNLAATVPTHASELYGKNVVNFLAHIAKPEGMSFDTNDEIIKATLVVHNGEVKV